MVYYIDLYLNQSIFKSFPYDDYLLMMTTNRHLMNNRLFKSYCEKFLYFIVHCCHHHY